MIGLLLAALLQASPPDGGHSTAVHSVHMPGPCAWTGAETESVTTLRRLLRNGCDEAAMAITGTLPSLPWEERLAILSVTAEVPPGEWRLGRARLALVEAVVGRLGGPPPGTEASRRAAFSTEALFTVVCLQRQPLPPGTFGTLLTRFVAAQRPDEALTAELLAMRRIYLRWRFGTDCAAEHAEALTVLEVLPEL